MSDCVEKDFSNPELENLTFDDFKKEYEVFKNFVFEDSISRE
jgi:hypothetical protein